MNSSDFGKGAIPRHSDPRDIQYGEYIAGASVVDWNKPYDIRQVIGDLPVNNQGSSLSCVGQASSKLAEIAEAFEVKKQTRLSARDIYSRIYVAEGGAYGYKGLSTIVQRGVATEKRVSSYFVIGTPTEAFMRIQDNSPDAVGEAKIRRAKAYAHLSKNIDEMAHAIKNQNGIVFGVTGTNEGWGQAIPITPESDQSVWYHFIVGIGYKLINNKKHIVALNSWGDGFGDNGYCYISEDYIAEGWTFNAMTLIDLPNPPEKIYMKRVIKLAGKDDQFIIAGGRKIKIPDIPTLAFLRDVLQLITGYAEEVPQSEFDSFETSDRAMPSVVSDKVNRELYLFYRERLPLLKDAYEAK